MDVRAYLQWCVETHQAEKERIRKHIERFLCGLVMVGMVALWWAAWLIY